MLDPNASPFIGHRIDYEALKRMGTPATHPNSRQIIQYEDENLKITDQTEVKTEADQPAKAKAKK